MVKDIKTITTNLESLTEEVQKTVSEEAEKKEEIRGDISFVLDRRLDRVIHSLDQSKKMYANFLKEKDQKQAGIWLNNMKNNYDRCHAQLDLQLNLIELMKILGATPARKYWFLLNSLDLKSEMYGPQELSTLHQDVEGYLKNCEEIKEIIKPWIVQRKN